MRKPTFCWKFSIFFAKSRREGAVWNFLKIIRFGRGLLPMEASTGKGLESKGGDLLTCHSNQE